MLSWSIPRNSFLYVANFIDDTVSGLAINSTDGSLTPALDSPFAAGTGPIWLATDSAGKTLYVTNIGSNNVSAYSIDATTGVTTALTASPFTAGTRPVSATVDPAGAFLYVSNQSSKNITKFQINPDYRRTSNQCNHRDYHTRSDRSGNLEMSV